MVEPLGTSYDPVFLRESPGITGGLSVYRNVSLFATGINVKNSAGQVYGWYLSNTAASPRFIKLYNTATAPVVGTDVPVMTLCIPAGSAANVTTPDGIAFALGIGIAATTLVADSDTTPPSANEVIVNLLYK